MTKAKYDKGIFHGHFKDILEDAGVSTYRFYCAVDRGGRPLTDDEVGRLLAAAAARSSGCTMLRRIGREYDEATLQAELRGKPAESTASAMRRHMAGVRSALGRDRYAELASRARLSASHMSGIFTRTRVVSPSAAARLVAAAKDMQVDVCEQDFGPSPRANPLFVAPARTSVLSPSPAQAAGQALRQPSLPMVGSLPPPRKVAKSAQSAIPPASIPLAPPAQTPPAEPVGHSLAELSKLLSHDYAEVAHHVVNNKSFAAVMGAASADWNRRYADPLELLHAADCSLASVGPCFSEWHAELQRALLRLVSADAVSGGPFGGRR